MGRNSSSTTQDRHDASLLASQKARKAKSDSAKSSYKRRANKTADGRTTGLKRRKK